MTTSQLWTRSEWAAHRGGGGRTRMQGTVWHVAGPAATDLCIMMIMLGVDARRLRVASSHNVWCIESHCALTVDNRSACICR